MSPTPDPRHLEAEIAAEQRRREELDQVLAGVQAGVARTVPKEGRIRIRAAQNGYGKELELSIRYNPAPRTA